MVLQSLMEGLWRSSHALVICVTWHGLSARGDRCDVFYEILRGHASV